MMLVGASDPGAENFTKSGATSLQIALPTDIIPPHQCDNQEPLMQIFDAVRVFSQKNNGSVCTSVPALQRPSEGLG
jgi:hypothetical protein